MSRELARPVAIALIRRGDEILVVPVPDNVKHVVGWRPAGGTIEFGERGSDTVVREIREELGVEVVDPSYLGTVDPRLYARERFDCVEVDGVPFTCVWKPLADFRAGAPLYPDGLLALIG